MIRPWRDSLIAIRVRLPGWPYTATCRVNRSFWDRCPALRSANIGKWLRGRGDAPWRRNDLPRYTGEFTPGRDGIAEIQILPQ